MKTYHWNGEYWYERNWSLWHHIRTWFIWIGGWEKANGAGWRLRYEHSGKLKSPAPVSLFGDFFTWYGWGWNIRVKRGLLVYSHSGGRARKMYISPNGTPSQAVTWLFGAPNEIKKKAEERVTL
jgi:hypothetical protein